MSYVVRCIEFTIFHSFPLNVQIFCCPSIWGSWSSSKWEMGEFWLKTHGCLGGVPHNLITISAWIHSYLASSCWTWSVLSPSEGSDNELTVDVSEIRTSTPGMHEIECNQSNCGYTPYINLTAKALEKCWLEGPILGFLGETPHFQGQTCC